MGLVVECRPTPHTVHAGVTSARPQKWANGRTSSICNIMNLSANTYWCSSYEGLLIICDAAWRFSAIPQPLRVMDLQCIARSCGAVETFMYHHRRLVRYCVFGGVASAVDHGKLPPIILSRNAYDIGRPHHARRSTGVLYPVYIFKTAWNLDSRLSPWQALIASE